MFAYIDESGNTGANLFDEAQPVFSSAALICRTEFDSKYGDKFSRLARELGKRELHANELTPAELELVASRFLTYVRVEDLKLFVVRAVKIDIALMKFFDIIFDSAENKAVPWQTYNMRYLRFLMLFKLAYIIDKESLRIFWNAIMESNPDRATEGVRKTLKALRPRVEALPDERSRQIVGDAFDWALGNIDKITFHANSKAARYGHLPNLAVFPELLAGVEQWSEVWKQRVKLIKHDKQKEFGRTLTEWHELFSSADPRPIYLPGGERHLLGGVFKSEFRMVDSRESPGLQFVDVVLSIASRASNGRDLRLNARRLYETIARDGLVFELSLKQVSQWMDAKTEELERTPVTELAAKRAQEMLELEESRRQRRMLGSS